MKKLLFSLAILLASTGLAAELTPAQRATIWTKAWSEIEERFVGFDRVPELNWRDSLQTGMQEALAEQVDVEFWRNIRKRVAFLRDGETTLTLPGNATRVYDLVPIRMMIAGDKVLVKKLSSAPSVLKSGVKVGDELLSVDGVPVFDYLEKQCVPQVSASTRGAQLAEAVYRVLTDKADTDAHLAMRRPDGNTYEVILKRNSNEGGNHYAELNEPSGIHEHLFSEKILYYRVDSFYQWEFEKNLQSEIDTHPELTGLILDLRWNSSGPVPMMLLSKLALFPLPMGVYREVVWKSVPSKTTLGTFAATRGWRTTETRMIEPAASVFRGKVAVLVGPETGGTAEQFLEPLVFAQRVTLMGDTTAGAGGNAMVVDLPAGGKLTVTVQRPVWENGFGDGKGFPPDIRILQSAQGLAKDKDEVIDAAVDFLKTSKK
jgi:C-terminal processing protease CtpA/Prc